MTDDRRFSNSELATYRRCKRKWYFGSYRQLQLKREQRHGAARLGTRVHDGLEILYNTNLEDALAYIEAEAAKDKLIVPELSLIHI